MTVLWIVFALMTAAAIAVVLWPVFRNRNAVSGGSDLAVYRDQVEEIDRDVALGLIAAADAQSARTEVARRMLRASETPPAPVSAVWARRALVFVAIVGLPVVASSVYLRLGSPELVAAPAGAESAAGQPSITDLVGQVEAHLARNPEDGRGWEVLAPVYFRLGRFEDAVNARKKALAYSGETAARQAELGEAIAAAANGTITADAKAAFERALALEPNNVKARFYTGLAAEQEGRRDEAAAVWRRLLATAPADAAWVSIVTAALARVEDAAPATAAVPSADAPGQDEMVRGMVGRLASRLKEGGGSPEDWARLVRSYVVLGDSEKAKTAASEGETALAGDPERLAQLKALLKNTGLEQ